MSPRNLKQALEQGYFIFRLYKKYDKRIRVTVKERFHEAERKLFIDFWIDREYFKRNYPDTYEIL